MRWAPRSSRLPRRRVVLAAIVLAVVLAAGGWMVVRSGPSSANATDLTYTVQRATLQQTVAATGTLAAAKQSDLDFAVPGTVTKVFASIGDHVKRGQPLARVDDTSLRAAHQSALASLSAARTQYSDDIAGGAGSSQLAADSAQIASARASLTQAARNLADATLRAPFSGVIAARSLDPGDDVTGNGSSGSGGGNGQASSQNAAAGTSSSSAFVLIQPGRFSVSAGVSAGDVGSVRDGMQVQLRPTGSDNAGTIFGTVTSVALVAESSSSGPATFPVTVTVTGTHANLYAGTSVTVSIITKQVSNVLAVPALALSSDGTTTYVTKMVGNKPVRAAVSIGRVFGAQTEITSGLAAGDVVRLATFTAPRSTRAGQTDRTGRLGNLRIGGFGGGFGGSFGGGLGGGQ